MSPVSHVGRARLVGWVILAALAGVTVVRFAQFSGSTYLIAVIALTPWWYFAAWPVAALALWRRRWILAVAAVALVIVQVAVVLPVWRPWSSAAAASGRWRLSVFDANVRYNNLNLAGIARQIEADHPQLVTLEEFSYANEESLLRTGAVSGYRWHLIQLTGGGASGFGVWSDVPLDNLATWYVVGHQEIEATIRPSGEPAIHLLAVHTLAPRGPGQPGLWQTELHQIAARVATEPRPLVVVGDFNATSDMKQFRAITDEHLDDAAVESGDGAEMTWPANKFPLPDLVRIDHLLYSPQLTVTSYRLGHSDGSDHRPLLVTLARAAAR